MKKEKLNCYNCKNFDQVKTYLNEKDAYFCRYKFKWVSLIFSKLRAKCCKGFERK